MEVLGMEDRHLFENPLNAPLFRVQTEELERAKR